MTAVASPTATAPALRRLYLVRFGFALVWAVLMFATGSDLNPLSVSLLVLYPLFDVAAAVADARSSRSSGLYVNIAVSSLATVGVAIAAASGIPAVLRVWGAWAIAAGLAQLVLAIARRHMGGQWPMIASGAISTLAGTSFILQAAKDSPSVAALAGYALLGGIFFLVSALRLRRSAS